MRRWTATVTPAGIVLTGGIWDQNVQQTGCRAAAAQSSALAHREVPLPPLRTIAPNGLAATPPMAWRSWHKFADKIDDRTIRAMADATVSKDMCDAATATSTSTTDGRAIVGPTANCVSMRISLI